MIDLKPSLEKFRSVFLGHLMSLTIPPRKEKDITPPKRPAPVVLVQFKDGVLYSDVWRQF
jgi:hypothetical protein